VKNVRADEIRYYNSVIVLAGGIRVYYGESEAFIYFYWPPSLTEVLSVSVFGVL
jgi:hypothetical protein